MCVRSPVLLLMTGTRNRPFVCAHIPLGNPRGEEKCDGGGEEEGEGGGGEDGGDGGGLMGEWEDGLDWIGESIF